MDRYDLHQALKTKQDLTVRKRGGRDNMSKWVGEEISVMYLKRLGCLHQAKESGGNE